MAEYQSVFDGKQIDEGIGKIINGALDKAVLDAQTAAGQAENALSGVTARLDVVPTGSTQIINDLTTGGAGSALSAGMGKQLRIEAEKHESDAVKHIGTAKKAAAVDGDSVVLVDSADAGKTKRLLWGNIKALFAAAKHGHQITDVANLESSLSNKADKTPPVEYDLPLATGISCLVGGYRSTYSKDQFGRVLVTLRLQHTDDSAFSTWAELLGVLPAGFRPYQPVDAVVNSMGVTGMVSISIGFNGEICVLPTVTTGTRVTCSVVFQAAT